VSFPALGGGKPISVSSASRGYEKTAWWLMAAGGDGLSAPTNRDSARESPTGELLRSLLADIRLAIELDAELARLELKGKGARLRNAGALVAAAVVSALFAFATLTAAAVLALAEAIPGWAAAILVGAALVVVALVLFVVGRSKVRSVGSLAPTETIRTAWEDVAWVRREAERLRSTE
jgi:uncharacterized membrane protein YqjE